MAISLLRQHREGIILDVRLTPNAAQNQIVRTETDANGNPQLRVSVTAVPENGKANKALATLLSKKLRLPKSSIRLIAGGQSRNKTLLFVGAPDELFDALDAKLRELGLLG